MNNTPTTELVPGAAVRLRARLAALAFSPSTGCVEWTTKDHNGYGRIRFTEDGRRRQVSAHRAVWIIHHGIEDAALVVDHLCMNRSCVNIKHLELVTDAENLRRGAVRRVRDGFLHSCGKHGRTDGYEKIRPDGYKSWVCRYCLRASSRRYKARLKAS